MPSKPITVVLVAAILIGGAIAGAAVSGDDPSRQQVVAERGAQVMPFDLEATTHTFERLEDGGLQTVTADMPSDERQIRLIREHLRKEADAFSRGNFSDPARIHGAEMPGLQALQAGANRITVQYTELPTGAQIKFVTDDPALMHALHGWFDAQVTDHGEHAEDGMQH